MNKKLPNRFDTLSISEAIDFINSSEDNNSTANILSGIEALDSFTDGWRPGELCVFGARPGMGKSYFVVSCISNIVSEGTPVALFSAVNSLNLSFISQEYFLGPGMFDTMSYNVWSCVSCGFASVLRRFCADFCDFASKITPIYRVLTRYIKMCIEPQNLKTSR